MLAISVLDPPRGLPHGVQARLLDLEGCGEDGGAALALLSETERAHYARFRHATDARRYALTRAALREWLGVRLSLPPVQIGIRYGTCGKPMLDKGELHFNVAHAGRYSLLALSEELPVGVDIERIDMERPLANIASQAFSQCELEYCSVHGVEATFYSIWTGKEALLKASGSGIDEGIRSLSVIPAEDVLRVVSNLDLAPQVWRLTVPHGYAAALSLIPLIRPPA